MPGKPKIWSDAKGRTEAPSVFQMSARGWLVPLGCRRVSQLSLSSERRPGSRAIGLRTGWHLAHQHLIIESFSLRGLTSDHVAATNRSAVSASACVPTAAPCRITRAPRDHTPVAILATSRALNFRQLPSTVTRRPSRAARAESRRTVSFVSLVSRPGPARPG